MFLGEIGKGLNSYHFNTTNPDSVFNTALILPCLPRMNSFIKTPVWHAGYNTFIVGLRLETTRETKDCVLQCLVIIVVIYSSSSSSSVKSTVFLLPLSLTELSNRSIPSQKVKSASETGRVTGPPEFFSLAFTVMHFVFVETILKVNISIWRKHSFFVVWFLCTLS